ncbi:histidine phosphatase family protein [Stappia sp. MMSF_3263]|uniref:histidine phosphatase family protein n=1 Tax=Stappia sp. MMSF_3263 TaxID=3046693 RepID=UPI00273DCC5A|nr:histidine phosphatase family protein [Stappia sp. MMSF_3263]
MIRPDGDCIYLTHPQVEIDPAVPVPDWGLSEAGFRRARAGALLPVFSGVRYIVSSAERKARQTAEILAGHLGLRVVVDELMHENDRSATGFLPPPEFEAVADRFFAAPDESVRGWETARAAQTRILGRVRAHLAGIPANETVLFVGHGGVGTLLKCHVGGFAIDRRHDQPPGGGGCFFMFSRAALDERSAKGLDWLSVDD